MTVNEMTLMVSIAVDMQDKEVNSVLDKIRADVINIAYGRQSIKVGSVLRIIDKYMKESEET